MPLILLCGLLLATLVPDPAGAGQIRGAVQQQVGFDQHPGARLPLDLGLVDTDGEAVRLGELYDGRPVVLVLAYYQCPNLCETLLAGVLQALAGSGDRAGEDYELVVVGIDPDEGPAEATAERQRLLSHRAVPGDVAHLHFLTGTRPAIRAVAAAAGFRYHYDEQLDQYAHAAGLVVTTPEGRISRYLFGVRFDPQDLRLALAEAGQRHVGNVVDQVLLLCYQYDPTTGQYGVAILRVLRLAALASVLLLGGAVLWWLRRERRQRNRESHS